MTRTALALSSALALAGLTSSAGAQETATGGLPTQFANHYGQSETARITALGGAIRSVGGGTAGIFLNPAGIALTRLYHVEGILQATPEVGRIMGGGVVVDSIMNRYGLAGGLAVQYGILDVDGVDWSALDVRIGLAFPISERLFIGVAPRYASLSQGSELPPPEGAGAGEIGTLHLHAFTFDAGLIVKPTESLHVSVVGQNITSTHRGTYPTTIGGGIGYGTELFSLEFDAIGDLNSYEGATARLMGGAELVLAEYFPVRLGYSFDQGASIHALSGGLGYVGREFSVEASVRRTLSSPGATTIVVGLAYHLESSGLIKAATEGYSAQ